MFFHNLCCKAYDIFTRECTVSPYFENEFIEVYALTYTGSRYVVANLLYRCKDAVDCDIVDANGNLLEKDGVKQAPHSHIELTGSDLVGLDLPVQVVANKVYGLEG